LTVLLLVVVFSGGGFAQENSDCLMCHEDPELVGERGGWRYPSP